MLIKVCLLIALASVAMSYHLPDNTPTKPDPVSDEEYWKKFKIDYQRNYKTLEEEAKRFEIFKKRLHQIQEHNKKYEDGETSYIAGINEFTDLTQKEFEEHHLGLIKKKKPAP